MISRNGIFVMPENPVYIIYQATKDPLSLHHIGDRVYTSEELAHKEKEILETQLGMTNLYVMVCELIDGKEKTITLKQPIEVSYRYEGHLIINFLLQGMPISCALLDFLFTNKASFTEEDKQQLKEAGYELPENS